MPHIQEWGQGGGWEKDRQKPDRDRQRWGVREETERQRQSHVASEMALETQLLTTATFISGDL